MLTAIGKRQGVVGILVLVGLVLMLGVPLGFITNAQVGRPSDRKASGFAPEPQLYRTLFHTIFLLNEQAEEVERAGRTEAAQALRRAFRQEAKLGAEESAILDRVAAECEEAVRAVDAQAREILAARRANYPDGKLREGQEPLPPSPELFALQREREVLVLRYRDQLQEAFGPRAWERFEQRVLLPFAAGLGAGGTQRYQPVEDGSETDSLTTQAGESIVTGSAFISYDAATNLVTGVATIELDYAAQDWYVGQVTCSLRDGDGNPLVSQSAYGTDGDGTVSVIVQTVGQAGTAYSAEGSYKLRLVVRDTLGRYLDYWDYPVGVAAGTGILGYNGYYAWYRGVGPFRWIPTWHRLVGRITAPLQRAVVFSGNPTFTANPISSATGHTHVDVDVETNTAAGVIEPGDFAVLAINVSAKPPGASVTFANPPGTNVNVPLNISDLSTGRFTIASVSKPGQYRFRVSIVDIRRPDGRGGSYSILNRVRVNDFGFVSDPPLTAN